MIDDRVIGNDGRAPNPHAVLTGVTPFAVIERVQCFRLLAECRS